MTKQLPHGSCVVIKLSQCLFPLNIRKLQNLPDNVTCLLENKTMESLGLQKLWFPSPGHIELFKSLEYRTDATN